MAVPLFIPSPSVNGVWLGPFYLHFYGLMYVVGIASSFWLIRRRWRSLGGDPELVMDIAIWSIPIGLIGARLYSIITTPEVMPHVWWGPFAIWDGGLGVWGGIAAGAVAALWRLRHTGADPGLFANAAAPGLFLAQGLGRLGNYFNQELFGKPSTLPWALHISPAYRPPGYGAYATFQPSFLYELLADLAMATLLIWMGRRFAMKPWSLFALYVAGYSGYRIFEETIRIDDSHHVLGLRVNFFVAGLLCIVGVVWFLVVQLGSGHLRLGRPAETLGPTSRTATNGGSSPAPPAPSSATHHPTG
ncbi:MAG: prolipoprotein diacylglyceryl transferase [Acidimicrobiales bacterium]